MKVAFFLNTFPVLSQTFILDQITGLIDRGLQVDLFAGTIEDSTARHEAVERYGLMDRIRYPKDSNRTLPPAGILKRLVKAPSILVKNRRSRKAPLLKALNILALGPKAVSLRPFYETAAFLNTGLEAYDIVHAHFGPRGIQCALLKRVGLIKGKLLTSFYGYDATKVPIRGGPHVYRLLFQEADAILCLTRLMKKQLIGLGCPEEKAIIHYVGVDMRRFSFLPRQKRPDGSIRFITASRLVEKKGLEYAIRAVAKVAQRFPGLEYRIVGDGPIRKDLEGLIGELKVEKVVQLLGWKTQEEVVKLLEETDIFLAPSVTAKDGDEEGKPKTLIEALARGMPVVSTYHSAIPELVQDGVFGFLVPERDVEALAAKIEHLATHPEIWTEMGRAGRIHVQQNYDIEDLNDKLVGHYEQLLGQTARTVVEAV
jgi:colanic acid/amylovoran biosynthesis glycosyltransferase